MQVAGEARDTLAALPPNHARVGGVAVSTRVLVLMLTYSQL